MRFLRRVLKSVAIVAVVLAVWSVFRAGTPATAFRREIVVNVPREVAWEHFSRPRAWSSWMRSGAPTEVTPSDVVGPDTVAKFGDSFEFRMTEFAPPDHWMWSSRLGWLTVDYDHRFEPIGDRQTRMVFHQTVTGFGNDIAATLLGALTTFIGHQDMLNRLAAEMNQLPAARPNSK
jgi:hypothetical protein